MIVLGLLFKQQFGSDASATDISEEEAQGQSFFSPVVCNVFNLFWLD